MEPTTEQQLSQSPHSKPTYKFRFLGAIVFIIFFSGIAGYLIGTKIEQSRHNILSNSPTNTPTPMLVNQTTPFGNTSKWDIYYDTPDNFTIEYPDTLQYSFDTNVNAPVALLRNVPTILFTSKNVSPNDNSVNIVMVRVFKQKTISVDTAAKSYFSNLDPNWKNISIGNYTGQITNALDTSGKQVGLVALLSTADTIYYFHLSNLDSAQNITQNDFNHMLETFQLQSSTPNSVPPPITPTAISSAPVAFMPLKSTQDLPLIALAVINWILKNQPSSNPQISFTQNDGMYAQGLLGDLTQAGGEGWFAAKINGTWTIVYVGQSSPKCSNIAQYNLPKTWLSCY